MRGGWLALLTLVGVLVSCGLETVESLDPPFGDQYYNELIGNSVLNFKHGSQYADTSFFGYLVYYKIYPNSATEDFGRLLEDRDKLAASPTVNQLATMGYSSLTRSRYKDSSASSGLDALLIEAPSIGADVAIDFTDLLDTQRVDGQPVLLINGSLTEAPYLYRSMALAGKPAQKFSTLRTSTTREADMAPLTTEQLSVREYEIAFFVIAYGLDAKLNEIYSKPAPWGIIRKIAP